MFRPVTKWNTRVERVAAIPEIVRKAFRVATLEKPGPTHVELPEDLAGDEDRARARPAAAAAPGGPTSPSRPTPRSPMPPGLINDVRAPDRPRRERRPPPARRAELRALAKGLHLPVAATFMGKGAIDDRSHLSLMAVGLQARDHVLTGLRPRRPRHLRRLRPRRVRAGALEPGRRRKRIIHIDTQPAEVDAAVPARGRADRRHRRRARAPARRRPAGRRRRPDASERHQSRETLVHADLRTALLGDLTVCVDRHGYPIKPAARDLRAAPRPRARGHRRQRRRAPTRSGSPACTRPTSRTR